MSSSDVVIEAFTELAPCYERTMDRELRELWGVDYEGFVSRLVDAMPIEDSDFVLDVATGTARIPLGLASRTDGRSPVVGLDITLAMLEHGRKNIAVRTESSCIRLVCASAMTMPFAEGVFDAVTCGLGMHHLDVHVALAEMRRVLKSGGKLALVTVGALPSWRSLWKGALVKIVTFVYFMLAHKSARALAEVAALPNVHTRDEWLEILSDTGFSKIETSVPFHRRRSWYPDAMTIIAEKGVF